MKLFRGDIEKNSFKPLKVELLIESAEELEVFKALSECDITVPVKVEEKMKNDSRNTKNTLKAYDTIQSFLQGLNKMIERHQKE